VVSFFTVGDFEKWKETMAVIFQVGKKEGYLFHKVLTLALQPCSGPQNHRE
jgi:hypothetical protein